MVAVVRPIPSLKAAQPVIYTDFDTNFSISPDNGDLILLTNEEAIKASIKNIVKTGLQERPFNPTFGGEIRRMLFEPIGIATEESLSSLIETAIKNFESRAVVDQVVVSGEVDENAYVVTIIFHVINSTSPIQLDFILNRIR